MTIDTQKPHDGQETRRIMIKAADTIDAQAAQLAELRVERDRLRAALAGMIEYAAQSCGMIDDPDYPEYQAALRAMEAETPDLPTSSVDNRVTDRHQQKSA